MYALDDRPGSAGRVLWDSVTPGFVRAMLLSAGMRSSRVGNFPMSLDISLSAAQALKERADPYSRRLEVPRGPIVDLIVAFTGYDVGDSGDPLPPNDDSSTASLVEDLRTLPSRTGHKIAIRPFYGERIEIGRFIPQIEKDFHPLGRLVIYGYSLGGHTALGLARYIGHFLKFYSLSQRRFFASYDRLKSGDVFGSTRVDLLITIDASLGYLPGAEYSNVARCVRRNLNLYQSNKGEGGARGHAHTAEDPSRTKVENIDMTGQVVAGSRIDHKTIGFFTNRRSYAEIEEALRLDDGMAQQLRR